MPKRKRSEKKEKESKKEKGVDEVKVKASDLVQRWHWYSKGGVIRQLLELDPNSKIQEESDNTTDIVNVEFSDERKASFIFSKIKLGSNHICTPTNVSIERKV